MNFNSSNRITSVVTGGGTRTYGYDFRGNVTNTGESRFTYDLANQPRTISGVQSGSFTYDGNLKRVKKIADGETVYFIYTQGAGLIVTVR